MSKQRFTIPGRLTGLNEYTAANRANARSGGRIKRENQDIVCWAIRASRLKPARNPVRIRCLWVEKDRRRDHDNVAFAIKFIQDALVSEGILHDDGWQYVTGFEHFFAVDKHNPRVEVEIMEEQNEKTMPELQPRRV